jgi:hypothetical protein
VGWQHDHPGLRCPRACSPFPKNERRSAGVRRPSPEELSRLLAGNREGSLAEAEPARLDELIRLYRRGLVRKAQALRIAVARGLGPRLA